MYRATTLVAIVLVLAACGKDSPSEPQLNLDGSMSARIDGSSWSATSALAVAYSGGILAFAGSDATSTTIGIGVIPDGPGTYPIGTNQPTNANLTFGAGKSWGAASTSGSGSVTITAIDANSATGTFEFTAEPVATTGATGTHVVTSGAFSVKF
jgi:hypothetical protein